MKLPLTVITLLFCCASLCFADAHSRALLDQARAGNPVAMRKLSISLSQGDAGNRNIHFAFEWMKKAADAGDVPAMYLLGTMYESGRCTPKSVSQAVTCYTKAADKGNKKAVKRLEAISLRYTHHWFEKEARCGNVKCMLTLAKAYATGKNELPVNKDEAVRYYRMAYAKDAKKTLKNVKKLPLAEALPFWQYLAEQKRDIEALKLLANAYGNGDGVEIDDEKSRMYYSMAAQMGDEESRRITESLSANNSKPAVCLPTHAAKDFPSVPAVSCDEDDDEDVDDEEEESGVDDW